MIPEGEVGCKICDKSIYRIFVEHVQNHLDTPSVTTYCERGHPHSTESSEPEK